MRGLHAEQIQDFGERGFTILRDGFTRSDAASARAQLWQHIDADPNDPGTWREPVAHIEATFGDGPFARVYTPRVRVAIDQLLGARRWRFTDRVGDRPEVGWFAVAFPGFDKAPYQMPALHEWHLDIDNLGQPESRVRLNLGHQFPRPQALVVMPLFSDVVPRGGGTVVWLRSHFRVARLLANAEPKGLLRAQLVEQARTWTEREPTRLADPPAMLPSCTRGCCMPEVSIMARPSASPPMELCA